MRVEKAESLPQTRVVRALDEHGIPYRVLWHSEPVYTIEVAARQRGVVKEEMVKSILLRERGGRYVMACVTGDARLDHRAVRACLPPGWKRLQFATAEEIREVTGSVPGAVAPLGLPDHIPVIFDKTIAICTNVSISSGDLMVGLELDAHDLIRVSGAKLASIAETDHQE